MESRSSVTLFLLLCLAFSVSIARPLVPPGTSDPDASSELAPEASPYRKPVGLSRLAPSVSPTGGPAASPWSDMVAQVKGPSANDAVSEAAKYVSELDGPMPSMQAVEDELGPAASAVKDKAAALGPAVSSAASAAKDKAAELGPAASAAMNKVASWAAELKGPPAN